jgi:hypothetical protein
VDNGGAGEEKVSMHGGEAVKRGAMKELLELLVGGILF